MMLETNIDKASRLVQSLLESIPIDLLRDAVIFGSTAITLHRIDLHRAIDDLDVFISEAAFSGLRRHPGVLERRKYGKSCLTLANREAVELWPSFPGVEFESIKSRACPVEGSRQLPVAALPDLAAWKKAQGRPKDLDDLRWMGSSQDLS
jgi:hypothetical protein